MKKLIYNLLISFLLVGMVGCYDDKGNYDYLPVPNIQLTAEESQYVTQFDTLRIPVKAELDGMSESDFDFTWRMWPNTVQGDTVKKVISTSKDLIYRVSDVPGSYTLVLSCCNKHTDVNTYKTFKVSVSGTISEGWMVLHEKDGKTDFDLIMTPYFSNRYKEDKILSNLYETVNGEQLEGRGVRISSYFAIGRYQYVMVLTETGGVRLQSTTMQKVYDIPTLMLDKKPLKIQNYFFYDYYWCLGNGNEVIISDGRFYINKLLGGGYTEPILKDGETYRCAAYAPKWLWTFQGVMYDELHSRFLGVTGNMLTVTPLPKANGRQFDWNNMNATMKYMDTGFKNYDYALMQDKDTHKYGLYVLNFDVKDNFDVAMYEADNCPELDKAKYYAIGNRGNIFYYATDKDIYIYDYAGSNTGRKAYTLANGNEKITGMKILKPCIDRFINNHPYNNKVLILSTYNESTKEGKIYMYYINESNGNIDMASEKVFGGFGEILDMDYNIPKYGA